MIKFFLCLTTLAVFITPVQGLRQEALLRVPMPLSKTSGSIQDGQFLLYDVSILICFMIHSFPKNDVKWENVIIEQPKYNISLGQNHQNLFKH